MLHARLICPDTLRNIPENARGRKPVGVPAPAPPHPELRPGDEDTTEILKKSTPNKEVLSLWNSFVHFTFHKFPMHAGKADTLPISP